MTRTSFCTKPPVVRHATGLAAGPCGRMAVWAALRFLASVVCGLLTCWSKKKMSMP